MDLAPSQRQYQGSLNLGVKHSAQSADRSSSRLGFVPPAVVPARRYGRPMAATRPATPRLSRR